MATPKDKMYPFIAAKTLDEANRQAQFRWQFLAGCEWACLSPWVSIQSEDGRYWKCETREIWCNPSWHRSIGPQSLLMTALSGSMRKRLCRFHGDLLWNCRGGACCSSVLSASRSCANAAEVGPERKKAKVCSVSGGDLSCTQYKTLHG